LASAFAASILRRLGRRLQTGVDRRAHRVGAGGQRLDAGHPRLAAEQVDEVEPLVAPRPLRRDQAQGLDEGLCRLLGGDRALFPQPADDVGPPLPRPLGIAIGAVEVRALRQAGEQRGLGEVEVLDRLPEPALRRHLDAVGAAAEVDRVEVGLEDLGLRHHPLEARGDDHLPDLSLVGDVVADEQVLHHLLRDGRAAGRAAGRGEVGDEGADHAALVDAPMGLEALVLRGDEGSSHQRRHVADRHRRAPPVRLERLAEALAPAVEDRRGARQPLRLELARVGQVGRGLVVELDHRTRLEGRVGHRLVLAELAVGREQLLEVEALQDLGVARHRLGVVHGGGDEVVEVDVLDVEGFAHVRAAVAQDLHDLGPVAGGVELRPHGVGSRRDLAQGQRGREELDEDRVHSARGRAPGAGP
jgi:hypothetical protein